jgi:hypothetical protein
MGLREDPFTNHFRMGTLIGCAVRHLSDAVLRPLGDLAFCLHLGGPLYVFDPVYKDKDGLAPRLLRKGSRNLFAR